MPQTQRPSAAEPVSAAMIVLAQSNARLAESNEALARSLDRFAGALEMVGVMLAKALAGKLWPFATKEPIEGRKS